MSQKHLTRSDIHGSDPLARFLFERLNIGYYSLPVFYVLAGILYAVILPLLAGRRFAIDGISLLNIVLVFPVAGYYYAYQPTSILRVYHSVARFMREEEKDRPIPYERLMNWHARRAWWIAGWVIGGTSAGFAVLTSLDRFGQLWDNINWVQIIVIVFIRFLALAMIGIIAARHIATSIALNKLFEAAQFPLTLDTDRIEVFAAVKKLSLEIIGFAAILGLNLGLEPVLIAPPVLEYAFYISLYFVLTPVGFFLPLWEVHRKMVQTKEEMLVKLHNDYQEASYKLYSSINRDARSDPSNKYLKQSQSLASIKQAIELVRQSPDWPFEGSLFYRLSITLISPFILAIWNTITNAINDFVLK